MDWPSHFAPPRTELRLSQELPRQRIRNELARFRDAVERDERAEAWTLLGPKQHFINGAEPIAQRVELMPVADGVDDVLQFLGVERFLALELIVEILQRDALPVGGGAEFLGGTDLVLEVADGVADETVQFRIGLWRRA